MSLDYNISNIEDKDTVCWDGNGTMKLMTSHLIWATMFVEIGEIKEDNAGEFYARLSLLYGIGEAITHVRGDGEDVLASAEDIVAHIGLKTNVTTRTRRQWLGRPGGYVSGPMDERAKKVKTLISG